MSTPRKAGRSGGDSNSSADGGAQGSGVQVVVRVRPTSDKEKAANDATVVGVSSKDSEVRVLTALKRPGTAALSAAAAAAGPMQAASKDIKTYTFDQVYSGYSTQEEVYTNAVKPLVEEVLAG